MIDSAPHRALALEAAREGLVLLINSAAAGDLSVCLSLCLSVSLLSLCLSVSVSRSLSLSLARSRC